MDQLDAMRAFVSVANIGSFSEAARQRRLSPSAVTRAVAQLEDELGVMLLTRTTRSVRLTERGRVYLETCRQILDDVEAARQMVRGLDATPRGDLRVAAPILFGRLHVLPVVEALLAANPDLAVQLTLSDRNVHLVEDGVDVAVRIGDLADSSLISTRLGSVSRVLAASPAYLARRGTPASLDDLARHDLIAFEGLEVTDEWRFRPGDAPVRVRPRLAVNSADAALAAAEAGLGIVRTLSYQADEALAAGRLVRVLAQFTPPPLPVSAVFPERRIPSANVAAFMAAARSYFRSRPVEAPVGQA